MPVMLYVDGEAEPYKWCPRIQIGGSEKREQLLGVSSRISGRGGSCKASKSASVEMVMAFKVTSHLWPGVQGLG